MTVMIDMPPFDYEVVKPTDDAPVRTSTGQWLARLLMLLSWLFMLIMNTLTAISMIKVSNEYPTRITPADFTFMIWTPIFLSTGAFVVYAFVNRGPSNSLPPCAIATFVANTILNGLWGVLFAHKIAALSVIVNAGTLITAWKMYSFVFPSGTSAFPAWSINYWCRQFAWSIYAAWMTVANLVNIEWAQQYYQFYVTNEAQNIEAVVIIALAVLLGLKWTLVREDVVATSVLLWTFIGIAVHQFAYQYVFVAAVAAAGAALSLVLLTVLRRALGRV